MNNQQNFLDECKEIRNNFAGFVGQYSVGEHLKLRTQIDSLLIMYDQLCERVRVNENIKKELEITDYLLAENKKVLDAIPQCPIHGNCNPHAIEWIEKMKLIQQNFKID